MNERNPESNHRNISGSFFCPACGTKYTSREFDMVTEKNNSYVLSVKCHNCNLTVMMNIVSAEAAGLLRADNDTEVAISANDVIDFSVKIKKFDGNFRRAFTIVDR